MLFPELKRRMASGCVCRLLKSGGFRRVCCVCVFNNHVLCFWCQTQSVINFLKAKKNPHKAGLDFQEWNL